MWLVYISYSGKYRGGFKLGGLKVVRKSAKICYNLLHNVDITVRSLDYLEYLRKEGLVRECSALLEIEME